MEEALGRLVVADPWKARRCLAGVTWGRPPRRKCVCGADLADAARVWSLDLAQGPPVGVVQAGGWRDGASLNKADSSSPASWLPCGQVTLLELTAATRTGMCPRGPQARVRSASAGPGFSGEQSHRGLSPPRPALPLPAPPAATGRTRTGR